MTSKNNNNSPRRKCKSEAQKKAIRRSYAKRAAERNDLVPVTIKRHYDSNGNHPHVIIDNIDDCHVSVGLTRDKKKGKNSPNFGLEVNPLGGAEQSYMRRQGTVAPVNTYYGQRKGDMTEKDYSKAKEYGAKAKAKYIDKKNKKK